jgi:N-acetyl-gamma-glutamyl-phosphate reductase
MEKEIRSMVKVKVIGATGYGGVGIVELLLQHPEARLTTLVAREDVGQPLSQVYPHLTGFCDLPILAPDDPRAQEPADVVFCATPDGVGMKAAPEELARGAKLVDYSGDFRFTTAAAYGEYATRIGRPTPPPIFLATTPTASPSCTAMKSARRRSSAIPVASP